MLSQHSPLKRAHSRGWLFMFPLPLMGLVNMDNPLLWAVLIGWIISVILHEFGHGIAAHWGGDYTIQERGGLSLNPLQYIDPLFSLIIPAVIFLVGGLPLPGGVTYIRRDLLRSRAWDVAVSLAGPAMNFLLFLACALPLHPSVGWVDYSAPFHGNNPVQNTQIFLAALAALQFIAILLNLVPVPPLDGFQAIAPFLPPEMAEKLRTPPLSQMLFFGFFLVIWTVPGVIGQMFQALFAVLEALGFDHLSIDFFRRSFNMALFGRDG